MVTGTKKTKGRAWGGFRRAVAAICATALLLEPFPGTMFVRAEDVQEEKDRIVYDADFTKSAEDLVKKILSSGLVVSDCQKKGTVFTFKNGMKDVGMESGIILDCSGKGGKASYDPDLKELVDSLGGKYAGSTAKEPVSNNNSVLEFSMTATGTLLNFNYAFASQEFNQSATYNDVFGLFVSVNGEKYENIALITRSDGTQVPVTITNLRAGVSGNEMNKGTGTNLNDKEEHTLFRCSNVKVNGQNTNGISNVFNAQKEVKVGDKIKLKFAVTNVGDDGVPSYVFIEAGSLRFDTPGSKPDYANEKLSELDPGISYQITCEGEQYVFKVDETGEIPFKGTDQNGKEYDFIGRTLEVVVLDEKGEVASDAQTVGIAPRPDAPEDLHGPITEAAKKPEDVRESDIVVTTDSITVSANDCYQYKLDNGEWTSPKEGKVVFADLSADTEYTVYTRVAATDKAPASESSDGLAVRTRENLVYSIQTEDYKGIYDGKKHGAVVTAGEGTQIAWSLEEQINYSAEKPEFMEPGEYEVYYRVTKPECCPAYGKLSVQIEKAPLSVSVNDLSLTYGDALPQTKDSYTIKGLCDTDRVEQITLSTTAKDVTDRASVSANDLKIFNGTTDVTDCYEITYKAGSLVIKKAPLTIRANDKSIFYGESISDNGVTYEGFVLDDSEYTEGVLDGTLSYSYQDQTGEAYTPESETGTYRIIPSGLCSDNYEIRFEEGALNVCKKSMNTIAEGYTGDYDGKDHSISVKVSDPEKYTILYAQEKDGEYTETPITKKDAGTYTIYYKVQSSNYEDVTGSETITIRKVPLAITAKDHKIRYGTDAENDGVTCQGFVEGEDTSVLDGTLIYTYQDKEENNYDKQIPAGTYSIVPAGVTSGNYDIRFHSGTLTVDKAKLSVSAEGYSGSYDGKTHSVEVTVETPGEFKVLYAESEDGEYSETPVEKKNAGNYTVYYKVEDDNYEEVTGSETIEITRVPLTIKANDKEIKAGKNAENAGVTCQGFVNGENVSVLDGTLTYAYLDQTGKGYGRSVPAGIYSIVPSGVRSVNYEITYQNGILNVTKADESYVMNEGLKVTQKGNKIKVKWGRIKGVDGYEVYVAYCNRKNFSKKPAKIVKAGKNSVKIKKIGGRKLKQDKNFKVYVSAYKIIDGKKVTVAKTITAYVAGKKNPKYTNAKSIKVKKKKVTLKTGAKKKIIAKTKLADKKKKQLGKKYAREFRYVSTDESVATVTKKGKIKAKQKGECIVYVYARNGLAKKVKVIVK